MTISALISDLDGTLIDTRERSIQAHASAFQRVGYQIEIDTIRALYHYSFDANELFRHLNIRLSKSNFTRYLQGFKTAFYKNWRYSKVFPGVRKTLEYLREHVEYMRLITSRQGVESTRREVRHFGLDKVFDGVFTRGDLAQVEGKDQIPLFPYLPQRRRLLRFALQGVTLDGSVWVVGDTPGELEAAKSLGFTTIGVLTGFGVEETLKPVADYLLPSVAEIVQLI
ncbi:MAG: HAD family hydrolase [Candidatus Hodarchaeota archaeon]